MPNIFLDEHTVILKAFNECQVDYLLIGGYAVIYHGYDRTTGDMDIWLRPSNENKSKVIKAFRQLGYDNQSLEELNKYNFSDVVLFYLGVEPQKMEFLTKISLVDFDESNKRKELCHIDDEFIVPIIHYDDLVLSKINTGRTKDKADIEELQKLNRSKK